MSVTVFQSQNEFASFIFIQDRRISGFPGSCGLHAFVAPVACFDFAKHRNTTGFASFPHDKGGIAPTRPAKPLSRCKTFAAQKALGWVDCLKDCLNPSAQRHMSTVMQNPPRLTDRAALTRNRARASDDFLTAIACDELQDRIAMVNRPFTAPIIVGPAPEHFYPNALRVEDQDTLDLAEKQHDLAIHFMALHWANDPVGQIIQSKRALKPDGLFHAVLLGGQTLHELRACLAQAESEITGGLSPRILPMGDIRDLGALLQRAGLALPVADALTIKTSYSDAFALMRDIRRFGEGNALDQRLRVPTRRAVFERCATLYAKNYADGDRITATFEFLFLSGWAPDASQPQPLRPGSATSRLADALGTQEKPLND